MIAQPDTLTFTTQPGFTAYDAILRQDTLLVIANAQSVLYPFGQVDHAADIRQKYPQFSLTRGIEQAKGLSYSYTLLRYKGSAVKFYDNKEDGAIVVAGRITDPDLVLQNTIHTGMPLAQVLHTFFASIDQDKLGQLHVLRVDYSVDRLKCFYDFENEKLKQINMDSYSVMSKNL